MFFIIRMGLKRLVINSKNIFIKFKPHIVNRERSLTDEIASFGELLLQKDRKPDALLDRFVDLDIEKLRAITGKAIKAVLLDIDGCIAPPCGEILSENIERIRELLKSGLKIGVYSNAVQLSRLDVLSDLGIPVYDGEHPKPEKRGFLDACDFFGFDPQTTWMLGDNPLTDGGAMGVLDGVAFVKPILEKIKDLPRNKRVSFYLKKILRRFAMYVLLRRTPDIVRSDSF